VFLTFFGKERFDEHKVHVHESPRNMTVPLMVLAFFAIFGGWFAAPALVGGTNYFEKFLHPVFSSYAVSAAAVQEEALAVPGEHAASPAADLLHALTGPPVIVGLLGILLAWWFYIRNPELPKKLANSMRGLYTLVLNKYYVDELYLAVIVRP